ncbi:MAG: hypothetical protein ABFE07_21565, partial [Armatimonadia bacterium]
MALQYPGYAVPQPTTTKLGDVVDGTLNAFDQGKSRRQQQEAELALEKYAESLYGPQGAPGQPPPMQPPRSPSDNMVMGSVDAAMGAEDPMLASYFANTR